MDTIKKTLFSALKLVALTQDEVRSIVEGLEKEGIVTAEQGKRLIEAFLGRGRKEGEEARERLGREFQRLAGFLPLVGRSEFNELLERVKRMEERMGVPPEAPEELPPASAAEGG